MNKTELVSMMAERTGESKSSIDDMLEAMFDIISNEVARGEKVTIPGWISFERGHRAARQGINPSTGEKIQIAATNVAKVKAGSKLKSKVKSSTSGTGM